MAAVDEDGLREGLERGEDGPPRAAYLPPVPVDGVAQGDVPHGQPRPPVRRQEPARDKGVEIPEFLPAEQAEHGGDPQPLDGADPFFHCFRWGWEVPVPWPRRSSE